MGLRSARRAERRVQSGKRFMRRVEVFRMRARRFEGGCVGREGVRGSDGFAEFSWVM